MAETDDAARVYRYDDPDPAAWGDFMAAMHSGRRFECDEEMYYHWMEILPPAWMNRTVEIDGVPVRTDFGFVEGADYVTAFGRGPLNTFWGQRTAIMNPHA